MACRLISLPCEKHALCHLTLRGFLANIEIGARGPGAHRAHLVQRVIRLFNVLDRHFDPLSFESRRTMEEDYRTAMRHAARSLSDLARVPYIRGLK